MWTAYWNSQLDYPFYWGCSLIRWHSSFPVKWHSLIFLGTRQVIFFVNNGGNLNAILCFIFLLVAALASGGMSLIALLMNHRARVE